MYKCKSCDQVFPFPEVKIPDAGMNFGILGVKKYKEIKLCPYCMSVDIKIVEKAG